MLDRCDDVKITNSCMLQSNPCISVAACSLLTLAREAMSFSVTSKNIALDGTMLNAECEDIHGNYRRSSLDLNKYVVNHNGRLRFARQNGHFSTFRNIHLVGSVQHAECANRKGGGGCSSQLDLDIRIKNNTGMLDIWWYFEWPKSVVVINSHGYQLCMQPCDYVNSNK